MFRCLLTLLTVLIVFNSAEVSARQASAPKKKLVKETRVDLSKIKNEKVRSAMEAWQAQDLKKWLEHFESKAQLFDDGNPRDFQGFSKEITEEWFTSIDKIEDDSTKITGQFQTKKWGSFRVYFKFHPGKDGKFNRLDIGQASK